MNSTLSYHEHTLSQTANLTKVCDIAIDIISKSGIEFDSFAAMGVSGMVVAPVLAVMMNKKLTVVRKTIDGHSSHYVEGVYDCRYLIIDDFYCTGSTMARIQTKLLDQGGEIAGVYFHRDAYCAVFSATNKNWFERKL